MKWFRQTLRNHRVFLLTVLAVNIFYMVEGVRFVEAHELRLQEEERQLEELSAVFGIPIEKLRGDGESVFEPVKKLVIDGVGSAVEAGFGRLQKIVRQRNDQAVPHLSQTQARVEERIGTPKRSLSSVPQAQIAAAFPQEKEGPSPIQASGTERAPRSRERSASSLGASGGMPLPLRRVEKKVRTEEAVAPAEPSASMSHVWLTAHLDYIPNMGVTPGPGDTWVRMDPSLNRFAIAEGVRLDDQVPFDLGEYLESGTPFSPRQVYEEALQTHIADNHLGIPLEEVKPSKTVIQEAFPFVPGTLRVRILNFAGQSPEVPEAFQQQLDLELRDASGSVLATWSTPWSAVYGQRLEVTWPGATDADQAALDLYGGVFATPPYEVDLKPVIRVDGVEVAAGDAVGSAEDVVLLATITPPQGSPTVMQFELLAGEHGVFTVDFGQMPQEVIDHYTQERNAATDPIEEEAWTLALAGALYQRLLSDDLKHLAGLRWQRLVRLGTAVLAVQRGAVSEAADGTPLVFSKGPMSLDLGAMPLGFFPASGAAGSTVPTLELLGSQGSFLEGEALSQVIGGEQITAVTFLTRAVREGQTLTLVDAGNVDAALAHSELSAEAEAHVRSGVEQGKVAWIAESQLPVDTWQTSGYILEDPETGAGGYFVTFERLVAGLEANIVFHSPQDLEIVTAPIDVAATIEGGAIDSWTLSYQYVGAEGQPVVLATGTGSVSNATLAQFDPTLLLNGLYDIVLTGRDTAGQSVSGKVSVSVEGNMKIGNFTLSFIDLAIPLSGLDIEIVRTYDSRQREMKGDFGYGWTLDIRQGSYQNNRPPGDGWQIVNPGGPFGLPCSAIIESKSHLTTVRLSDQEIYRFSLRLIDPAVTGGGCFARAAFEYISGPEPGSHLEILGNDEVFYESGGDRVIDIDTFELYEPDDVRLVTRDGRIFHLDLDDGVTRVEDPNGNTLDITPQGITHSNGASIVFVRDDEARIVEIIDPLGNPLRYQIDTRGDLVMTTDAEEHSTTFVYDDHRIIDIIDPRGIHALRNQFDADGRLVKVIDPQGRTIELDHDLEGRSEVVTNRSGQVRVLEYDIRGNIVREVDELERVTVRTYDSQDRLLTMKDHLGNTATNIYDSGGDLVETRDPLGNTTRITYDTSGNPLTITAPRENVTTHAYDVRGNLLSTTDPLGNVTTFTYEASGNPVTRTDALGNVTTSTYDSWGRRIQVVDAMGAATDYAYDAAGNLLSQSTVRTTPSGATETLVSEYRYDRTGLAVETIRPDGSTLKTSYDAVGAVTETADPLGRVTRFGYNASGLHASTTYPDGTSDSRTYDAEGRLLTITDRAGRTSSYTYDEVGQLIRVTYPDGTTHENAYDAAGRTVATTDARGNTTQYSYDAAGRLIAVTDALGKVTALTYDAAGNQTSVTDALGRITHNVFDDAGRLVKTILADGKEVRAEYDALAQRIADIAPSGARTEIAYDALGRPVEISDALGGVWRYGYDELGNRISQSDPNDHTTRFEYDSMGRLAKRILPEGAAETLNYNAVGNLVLQTDLKGATTIFEYDVNDRLIRRTSPDGSSVSFSYTPTGRRATAVDARGTIGYTYDLRDRLIKFTDPEGREIRYGYDAHGNRTSRTVVLGAAGSFTTSYAYDALNRLRQVVDANGGTYSFTHDAAGNRQSLIYPNGTQTGYAYDSRNQLLSLETRRSTGELLQSHTYTLDPSGKRLSVEEHDGTIRAYQYDLLSRLTRERVTGGDGALIYENAFTYDSVGNRLRQEMTADGTTTEVTCTYDARDRLLTKNGVAFAWDNNGNLTGTSDPGGPSYAWDFENRLIRVELGDGTKVTHTYDPDGVLIASRISEADGSSQSTEFLVDTSGALSQVVAEVADEGGVLAHHVRGDELLALDGPEPGYVHTDGLGSVRMLTDAAAVVTDRYDYEAYGRLLTHTGSHRNFFLFAQEQRELRSGLDYLRARWLDPETGRFLSRDPLSTAAFSTLPLPHYLYADADPVNNTDPSGLFVASSVITLAVGGISAIGSRQVISVQPVYRLQAVKLRPIIAGPGSWWYPELIESHLDRVRRVFAEYGVILWWGQVVYRAHDLPSSYGPDDRYSAEQDIKGLYFPPSGDGRTIPVVFITEFEGIWQDHVGIAFGPDFDNQKGAIRGAIVARWWRNIRRDGRRIFFEGPKHFSAPLDTAHEIGHALGLPQNEKHVYKHLMGDAASEFLEPYEIRWLIRRATNF